MITVDYDAYRPGPPRPFWRRVLLPAAVAGIAMAVAYLAMASETKPRTCDEAAPLRKVVAKYGESVILRGLALNGEAFEVWAARDGSTWTATATTPKGIMCVIGLGTGLETPSQTLQKTGMKT